MKENKYLYQAIGIVFVAILIEIENEEVLEVNYGGSVFRILEDNSENGQYKVILIKQ